MLITTNVQAIVLCALLITAGIALFPFTVSLTTGSFAHLRSTQMFNRRVYFAVILHWFLTTFSLLLLYSWNQQFSTALLLILEMVTLIVFLCFTLYLKHNQCPFCKRLLASEPSARDNQKHVCTACGKSW